MSQEIMARQAGIISVDEVRGQVNMIQDLMRSLMKKGEHYGQIPGCGDKPSLLKPGAEKISFMFRLAPDYIIDRIEMPNGHREFIITCSLRHVETGMKYGEGVGSCSTMESKYRFRGGEKEGTGQPVPTEYWNLKKDGRMEDAQALIGGRGYAPGKIDGRWEICTMGEKQEHDNPADYYNTVLKIGKKRAHVDAVLTATAASDIFTQDIEDLVENGVIKPKPENGATENHKPQPPRQKDDGQPKEKPTPAELDEFENELIIKVGAENVSSWLMDATSYRAHPINSVTSIASVKELGSLKGKLRK